MYNTSGVRRPQVPSTPKTPELSRNTIPSTMTPLFTPTKDNSCLSVNSINTYKVATVGITYYDVTDTVNGKRINYVRQKMMANVAELNTEVVIPIEETKKNKYLLNKLKLGFKYTDSSLG